MEMFRLSWFSDIVSLTAPSGWEQGSSKRSEGGRDGEQESEGSDGRQEKAGFSCRSHRLVQLEMIEIAP